MKRCWLARLATVGVVLLGGGETAIADYLFNTFDFPRASGFLGVVKNSAFSINNAGAIVGVEDYAPFGEGGPFSQSFLKTGNGFTNLDVPGSFSTSVNGINVSGQLAGYYRTNTGNDIGFLSTADGLFPINVSGASYTQAYGINDTGQVVGQYSLSADRSVHAFVSSAGIIATIDYPGMANTQARGINNPGQVVGSYIGANGFSHGFLDTHGTFTTVDYPGAAFTQAYGINNSGEIVGYYGAADGSDHGFLEDGGRFSTIDVPGSSSSEAYGINDSGQIVGSEYDAAGGAYLHGFVATPSVEAVPESGTLPLLSVSVIAALAWVCLRRLAAFRPAVAKHARAITVPSELVGPGITSPH